METWQFWTLIGVLVILAGTRKGGGDTTKVVEWLQIVNVTLGDLRAQNQEIIATLVNLPDQIDPVGRVEAIEKSVDEIRRRFAPTQLEIDIDSHRE